MHRLDGFQAFLASSLLTFTFPGFALLLHFICFWVIFSCTTDWLSTLSDFFISLLSICSWAVLQLSYHQIWSFNVYKARIYLLFYLDGQTKEIFLFCRNSWIMLISYSLLSSTAEIQKCLSLSVSSSHIPVVYVG